MGALQNIYQNVLMNLESGKFLLWQLQGMGTGCADFAINVDLFKQLVLKELSDEQAD